MKMNNISPALPSFLFMLVDDIGWSDFSYNNGTAQTPNIDAWARTKGTILLQDFHSGGTVCSPTRATVLTGRNHFRDCVDFVYGCSDMSQCIPDFEFAPSKTYTIGDAVRGAHPHDYDESGVYFAGKWHLGSFFNDSEAYGATSASPMQHGFTKMNATVEVVPTATTNCQCKAEWYKHCNFGHYHGPNHCYPKGQCCFNYWWDDPMSPHGVTNLTTPTLPDDSLYLADAFTRFLKERSELGKPFLAQISFHNCHIPFIGSNATKEKCAAANSTHCRPPASGKPPYTDKELDYYACLIELDNSVGLILDALKKYGYYDNTMTWFGADNGPEQNCPPRGICKNDAVDPQRPIEGPGSAGPLRGRKRDIYEGGHRVAGMVSFPAMVNSKNNNNKRQEKEQHDDNAPVVSWETVVTTDFLPTIMEILNVDRPPSQRSWAMDGRSIVPLLKAPQTFRWNETAEGPRSFGIGFAALHVQPDKKHDWGYRYGPWKYVEGSTSCQQDDCQQPQLFHLEADLGERTNLAHVHPEMLKEMKKKFHTWFQSVMKSRLEESKCRNANALVMPPSFLHDGSNNNNNETTTSSGSVEAA